MLALEFASKTPTTGEIRVAAAAMVARDWMLNMVSRSRDRYYGKREKVAESTIKIVGVKTLDANRCLQEMLQSVHADKDRRPKREREREMREKKGRQRQTETR